MNYIDYGMAMAHVDTIIDVNIVEYKRFDGTTSMTMPDCVVIDGERRPALRAASCHLEIKLWGDKRKK
jgi:hypothetical protein